MGGAARKYDGVDSAARFYGWVARRWDTAIGFHDPKLHPAGFTYERYADGIRDITPRKFSRISTGCGSRDREEFRSGWGDVGLLQVTVTSSRDRSVATAY